MIPEEFFKCAFSLLIAKTEYISHNNLEFFLSIKELVEITCIFSKLTTFGGLEGKIVIVEIILKLNS